ncbi:ATP synthase F0 subunit 8 (mitochondrion) [Aethina tumida]|uniref:ATP synthase complex subunit 8 n=1 Tax=Aethina tumida TaxID=116153 RepID=A0A343KHV7_AETTU|nr:ATP synthase F0 subunit 8 [Aethina tumida]ATG28327.1 ATP synthetase F0 subunit 8 [Aethina tumida]UYI30141.1 ATP synthase F0 subunit 8 [Aethina tumida]
MPQMAPLNWLMLFIYFIIIFLMFNVMNYYSFLYKIKSSDIKKNKISYSWKW